MVEEYIKKNFPCEPPCDSYGICDNCCDATLIEVGGELATKWRPIKTAPKDEQLLFLRGEEEDQLFIASWSTELNDWYLNGWGTLEHREVKYWLPIPKLSPIR